MREVMSARAIVEAVSDGINVLVALQTRAPLPGDTSVLRALHDRLLAIHRGEIAGGRALDDPSVLDALENILTALESRAATLSDLDRLARRILASLPPP